jgi:zinc transport system permease protein
MLEFLEYDFMLNALAASLLASIACGIIGSYIIVKRIVFITGGIAHTAYGGIGLGYLLGFNPLIGAVGFSLGAAGFISYMRKKNNENEDILIGLMWALGMALGILFISFVPGYVPDLMSYLFGNILTISGTELWLMLSLDFVIVSIVFLLFKQLRAVTFDEEFSQTTGLPVDRLYLLLMSLIAITIVILIKLVGIILVIALLSIPSAISIKFNKSLKGMMLTSIILALIFMFVGLLLSYYLNLPSGSTIIIIAVFSYLVSALINKFKLSGSAIIK